VGFTPVLALGGWSTTPLCCWRDLARWGCCSKGRHRCLPVWRVGPWLRGARLGCV